METDVKHIPFESEEWTSTINNFVEKNIKPYNGSASLMIIDLSVSFLIKLEIIKLREGDKEEENELIGIYEDQEIPEFVD